MSPLALQQHLLVQSLLTHPASPERAQAGRRLEPWLRAGSDRGLMAYRAQGHALAERCLAAAYPVLTQLLGEPTLQAVARTLWHAHPPVEGDIGLWGDALPGWLDACDDLRPIPYLSDVARAEWALHLAARAADAVPDRASLGRLQDDDAAALRLGFAPGTALLSSPWPVADLIGHHLDGQPGLGQVVAGLAEPRERHALVVREGWHARVVGIPGPEAAFTGALLAGRTLGEALGCAQAAAAAQPETPFDFTAWLLHAVQTGRITGVLP